MAKVTANFREILLDFKGVQGLKQLRRPLAIVFLGLLTGCSGMLPQKREIVASPFETYAQAETAFDKIVPNETTLEELFNSGYNISTFPNVETLTYLDLLERFLPRDSITLRDLDPDLRNCLEQRLRCRGYVLHPSKIRRDRTGSVFLDLFNFRRTVIRYGWEAEALFVIQDDIVVYKLWSGTQRIDEVEQNINPLGPLQNIGSALNSAMKGAFD
jgi:hypothetical protein